MAQSFLLTWTEKGWLHSSLLALIGKLGSKDGATEDWRFAAHRKVQKGDSVYVLKQGSAPRGIFGLGKVSGNPYRDKNPKPGQRAWRVPVTFSRLVDPRKEFLLSEDDLNSLPVPGIPWNTQSSGVTLNPLVERAISELLAAPKLVSASEASSDAYLPENLGDARERIMRSIVLRRGQRIFRDLLLNAYGRKCAITGCALVDLLEAAHIEQYNGIKTNDVRNGILLRTDMHTLFDCGLLAIDPKTLRVVIGVQVRNSEYSKLAGRKIRLPKDVKSRPSSKALAIRFSAFTTN